MLHDWLGDFGTILESPDRSQRYMLVAYRKDLVGVLPLSGPSTGIEIEWAHARNLRIAGHVGDAEGFLRTAREQALTTMVAQLEARAKSMSPGRLDPDA